MLSGLSADEACRLQAESQYGLITLAQALSHGMTKGAVYRRVKRGDWVRVHPGVFVVAGTPSSFRQRLAAAVMAVPGSVGFRRSAAAIYSLAGFPGQDIEIVTLATGRPSLTGAHIHRTNQLPDCDVVAHQGIPLTSPARTLLDIGSVASRSKVKAAVSDAVGRRLVTPAQVHDVLRRSGRPGKPGTRILRAVLAEIDFDKPLPDSVLEDLCFDLIRERGFPEPTRQFKVVEGGVFLGRVDLAYPRRRLAIEVDSWEFHSSWVAFFEDRRRSNQLVSHGWAVLHFTNEDARRPLSFLTSLQRKLEAAS